jgi:hypothetical protein
MSMILSPTGRPMLEMGGPSAWKVRIRGDIAISFQWVNGEPAMVLYKPHNQLQKGAYAICLSAAYEFVDRNDRPTEHLMVAAFNAAIQLGFYPDKSTTTRIMDIVCDYMEDLILMPPEPQQAIDMRKAAQRKMEPSLGEMVVKAGGRTIMETEI